MKITYFKYHLKEYTGNRTLYNLNKILNNFITKANFSFKNSIRNALGEHMYLVTIDSNSYMFVVTKNNDLAKLVDTNQNKLSIDDLSKILDANQEIGFASYVYITDKILAYASTMSGAKAHSFIDFINLLLKNLNVNFELIAEYIYREVSLKELLVFNRIAKIKLKISLISHIKKLLHIKSDNLNYVKLEFVPYRGDDLKNLLNDINNQYGSDYGDMIISAKEHAESELMDYMLLSEGIVADVIKKGTDDQIISRIESSIKLNKFLQEEIKKIKENEFNGDSKKMDNFWDNVHWPDNYSNL